MSKLRAYSSFEIQGQHVDQEFERQLPRLITATTNSQPFNPAVYRNPSDPSFSNSRKPSSESLRVQQIEQIPVQQLPANLSHQLLLKALPESHPPTVFGERRTATKSPTKVAKAPPKEHKSSPPKKNAGKKSLPQPVSERAAARARGQNDRTDLPEENAIGAHFTQAGHLCGVGAAPVPRHVQFLSSLILVSILKKSILSDS